MKPIARVAESGEQILFGLPIPLRIGLGSAVCVKPPDDGIGDVWMLHQPTIRQCVRASKGITNRWDITGFQRLRVASAKLDLCCRHGRRTQDIGRELLWLCLCEVKGLASSVG